MLPRLALTFAVAALLCPHRAFAQTAPPQDSSSFSQDHSVYPSPAYVAAVDGTATLERDGRVESSPLNMPLLSGDRLKTADGRVEVRFSDGSRLALDAQTTVDLQSDALVRLIDGRLRVTIAGGARSVTYRIDSSAGSVRIAQPGDYRVALLRNDRETQIELDVVRGSGEVFTDEGSTPVHAGERANASAGMLPSYVYSYNSAAMDPFDRWSEDRPDARIGASAQYLPTEMQGYSSTFDEYGDWRYDQSYGNVWYPRVAADWRPYYYGRWMSYPRYGWTWIAADRFGWPTHHYGRWGLRAGLWFWIPTEYWAPAYVSWAYATDYVSWSPLGWDNRPLIAINLWTSGSRDYSPWTVVSRSYFGRGFVNERALSWSRLDRGVRFTSGHSPQRYDAAVSRTSAAPIRYAGQRQETPRYINRGDQIVRSRTERPTAPASAPSRPSTGAQGAPSRADGRRYEPSRADEPSRTYARQDVAPSRTSQAPSRIYAPPTRTYEAPPRTAAAPSRTYERPATPSRESEAQPRHGQAPPSASQPPPSGRIERSAPAPRPQSAPAHGSSGPTGSRSGAPAPRRAGR